MVVVVVVMVIFFFVREGWWRAVVIRKIELQILRLRVSAFCLFVMEGSTDLRFDRLKTRARCV